MQEAAPPKVANVGELLFPDVEHSLPIKLLILLAFGWVVLGPVMVFEATRRLTMLQGLARYSIGVLLAIATLMSVEWGWPNSDTYAHRFAVLWQHLGSGLLFLGAGLGSLAVVLGFLVRRGQRSEGQGH